MMLRNGTAYPQAPGASGSQSRRLGAGA